MGQRRHRWVRAAQLLVSIALAVAVFAFVLPKIASYSSAWMTVSGLSGVGVAAVGAVGVFNLFTYWWQLMAALPGLTLAQAAVDNQTTTTIANVVPGGGAVAVGAAVAILRSWGFTGPQITLLLVGTGVWNGFLKLGLPIVALGILAIGGHASAPLLIPALAGLGILAGALAVFGLALWKESVAQVVGAGLGTAWVGLRAAIRRPVVVDWGEKAVRIRAQTIGFVRHRGLALTLTTLASHLGLAAVLLVCLRAIGVTDAEVGWANVLAVFALARLLSALPITPGGVGVVELALIAGIYAAGRTHATVPLQTLRAQITGAVLLFRALTYGIQIPLGAVTYPIWVFTKSWRRAAPGGDGPGTSP